MRSRSESEPYGYGSDSEPYGYGWLVICWLWFVSMYIHTDLGEEHTWEELPWSIISMTRSARIAHRMCVYIKQQPKQTTDPINSIDIGLTIIKHLDPKIVLPHRCQRLMNISFTESEQILKQYKNREIESQIKNLQNQCPIYNSDVVQVLNYSSFHWVKRRIFDLKANSVLCYEFHW